MNPLVTSIPPSLIRAINARKRPGDIDLGLGEPTLLPDPAPFHAAAAWVAENGCPYTGNAGDEVLVVEPCYLAYPKICAMEGVAHRMVALSGEDGFRPSAATVLAEVRPST